MIKLVCFDLDGVLADSKQLHRTSFNTAISEVAGCKYLITDREREMYEALPTREKLRMMIKNKSLPEDLVDDIFKRKQELTMELISKEIYPDETKIALFNSLIHRGINIAVCSNTIRKNLWEMLSRMQLLTLTNSILSNQDVEYPKPHSQMYLMAMVLNSANPDEVVIVEDSEVGLAAANRSGAHVLAVDNPGEVTSETVLDYIDLVNSIFPDD